MDECYWLSLVGKHNFALYDIQSLVFYISVPCAIRYFLGFCSYAQSSIAYLTLPYPQEALRLIRTILLRTESLHLTELLLLLFALRNTSSHDISRKPGLSVTHRYSLQAGAG